MKMQLFLFLYILGLNIFQATGDDNSTQMQYASLIIENSAIGNLTTILTDFVINDMLLIGDFKKTTECTNVTAGISCNCMSGFTWSNKVCQSQKCCGKSNCVFSQSPAHMCVANTTVSITGSITLNAQAYQNCLADASSPEYIQCNNNLTVKMKTVFSTLRGFDVLTITQYRVGSIIANFQMTIVSNLNSKVLIAKSQTLTQVLSATLNMMTTGVVYLSMPSNPVCYYDKKVVTCSSQDDLGTEPAWQLIQQGVVLDITNGTQAKVMSVPMQSQISLTSITELWAGEYTCSYIQKNSSFTIIHKARAVMDVSLLPNIYISTNPQYPRCMTDTDLLNVEISCQIPQSNETYNVTWTKQNIIAGIIVGKYSPGQTVYTASTVVNCNSSDIPQITCTFTNRCGQSRNTSINVNIISAGASFCAADGQWQDTKAGYPALLPCTGAAGQRQRQCLKSPPGTWDKEDSMCVNQDLYNVLQKAIIVDIGLGSLELNTGAVFSQLQGATNNTDTINTFANVNTSVQVLFSLSDKLNSYSYQINNYSTVNDLLESSSNLLEKSLQNSWTKNGDTSNFTLAEAYMGSVEQLVVLANVTSETKKTNLEVGTCYGTQCNNTVFNVTVTLSGSINSSVKTTGFQQLQNYLPNQNNNFTPNSIVVSTTTEKKLDTLQIQIDFPLLNPRPRNVEILCVSWDNATRQWSTYGCHWEGPGNEGRCICTHLSSFAILMSRYPIELPGLTEITYAGLSVSILSLFISLVIELIVWSAVVKTNTLYLRHTAHVNISLCLLIADCCFLASSEPEKISPIWCQTFVVLKHFCYLSMFFWMLCLSSTLLHQAVFLFHSVSKKNYLRFSLVLGYVCPFLIVFITFLTNSGGADGLYFSRDTCWLIYNGLLSGSIYTFLIPVGIIIFINVFSMIVVIMKLLDHPMNTEKSNEKEKTAAKTVVRTVILLTPIFGVTWIFGFGVMILDLTAGPIAYFVNYAFNLLNAFQGLLILLTSCLGDKMVRESLLNRLKKNVPTSTSESTTKLDSSWKK